MGGLSRVLLAAVSLLVAFCASAWAGSYCSELQAQYRQASGRSGELGAAIAAARRMGCYRPFLFREPPYACYRLMGRIEDLQYSGSYGPSEGERQNLMARMRDAGCLSSEQRGPASNSALETLCVRTCDGYFFPISRRAGKSDLGQHAKACRAVCPGTEVRLFYRPAFSDDVNSARDVDGKAYSDLPNASLYLKTYTEGCTCNPAGGWAKIASYFRDIYPDKMRVTFSADVVRVPLPRRKPTTELEVARVAETASPADATRDIRVVGPAYYFAR